MIVGQEPAVVEPARPLVSVQCRVTRVCPEPGDIVRSGSSCRSGISRHKPEFDVLGQYIGYRWIVRVAIGKGFAYRYRLAEPPFMGVEVCQPVIKNMYPGGVITGAEPPRSEERRVGEEGRSRCAP